MIARTSWLAFLLLSLLAVGCDDAPAGTPDAGGALDQCLAPADRNLVEGAVIDGGLVDGGAVDAGVYDPITVGGDCARGCIAELLMVDPAPGLACMNACFDASPFGPLSDGCQDCFIEAIYCTGNACPVECLGSDPALCDACFDTHCSARHGACTGL